MEGTFIKIIACLAVGDVNGVKESMIAHIIGGRGVAACPHASAEAVAEATRQREAIQAQKREKTVVQKRPRELPPPPTRGAVEIVNKKIRLDSDTLGGQFRLYNGHDMPFSEDQSNEIQKQALRAVIATNISFSTLRHFEFLKLFGMLRSAAPEIIPSNKVLGGRLLNEAADSVDEKMKKMLDKKQVGLS